MNFACGGDAIHAWHHQVHEDNIGFMERNHLNRLRTI